MHLNFNFPSNKIKVFGLMVFCVHKSKKEINVMNIQENEPFSIVIFHMDIKKTLGHLIPKYILIRFKIKSKFD